MAATMMIIGNSMYVSDGEDWRASIIDDESAPAKDRIAAIIRSYDPEWFDADELAEQIIAMLNNQSAS